MEDKIKKLLTNKKEIFLNWTKSYLYDIVEVPTQFMITDNSNMCCGIGYLVIKYKENLIQTYLENNFDKYRNIFIILMKLASERKLNNSEINVEGEFLDEKTIQKDFPEIYSNMEYYEFIVGKFSEDNDKNINKIEELCRNLEKFQPIILCKEVNIFVIFKLNDEEFLIIDSHIPFHGKIQKNKLINYLTSEGEFNGIISLGSYK